MFFFSFFRLAMKFEDNYHVVAYCDTDSLLTFAVHPDAPPLNELCQISERLGCLKIERDQIKKFFSTAAKTYSVETVSGEITIKAKGFNLLEKLLKDNSQECLLEKNVTKMFSIVCDNNTQPDSSALVFQKQIKVNPIQMVPALLPYEKSFKILNFIGPRRQIDINNWLDYSYERIKTVENQPTKIEALKTLKNYASSEVDFLFDCRKNLPTVTKNNENSNIETYQVQLVPKVQGLLPALPYGFEINKLKTLLFFYSLLE